MEQSCLRNTQCKNVSAHSSGRMIDSNYTGPISTSYKVVAVQFPYFGLQDTAESLIKEQQSSLFLKTHKMIMIMKDFVHAEFVCGMESSSVQSGTVAILGRASLKGNLQIEEMFIAQFQDQIIPTTQSQFEVLRNKSQGKT
eukprot:699086-Hanusia_phi.AAC.3